MAGTITPIRPDVVVACACGCTVHFRPFQQVTCMCGRTYGMDVNSRESKRVATAADRALMQLRQRQADNEDIIRRLRTGTLPKPPGSDWR